MENPTIHFFHDHNGEFLHIRSLKSSIVQRKGEAVELDGCEYIVSDVLYSYGLNLIGISIASY
jgi:hypothetical protein